MVKRTMQWQEIEEEIRLAYERNNKFIEESILVGGSACLYHKQELELASDHDFPPLQYSDKEKSYWERHAADFAVLEETEFMDTRGLRIGTLQFGFRLGPNNLIKTPRK